MGLLAMNKNQQVTLTPIRHALRDTAPGLAVSHKQKNLVLILLFHLTLKKEQNGIRLFGFSDNYCSRWSEDISHAHIFAYPQLLSKNQYF